MHRGSLEQSGSLTYFFSLMVNLDYHTLLATLNQVCKGLILNTWQINCGHTSLSEFGKSKPTAENLIQIAHGIIKKYVTPLPHVSTEDLEEALESNGEESGQTQMKTI